MPDIELLKRPSREGGDRIQDHSAELQRIYSCSRHCERTITPSPCVKKAVWHIQELKTKLENWCQRGSNNGQDHTDNSVWRFDSGDSNASVTPAELCIEGMGLCLLSNYQDGTSAQFWKGMGGVLVEVMSLIERLESDRQEAGDTLQTEKLKAQTLRKKQDSLFLWKQQQFPAAVQREYETCVRDITELKWHLKAKRDQMQRVRNSLSRAEAQNRRLVEDIDFVKKHGPLVKEKLQLESEIMKQIKSAEAEASEEFSRLSCELSGFQQELEQEELLVNKERESMAMELNDIRIQLKDRLSELQQLKSLWDGYCARIRETEEKLALSDEQLEAMLLRIPLLQAQETRVSETVLEIRAKLEHQDKSVQEEQSELAQLQKQIQTARREGEAELSESEEVFSRRRQDLQHLQEENKEHQLEIEDYDIKTQLSKQTVKQLQRDRKRVQEKIAQNEEEREQVKGELTLEATRHVNTKARLTELEHQTFQREQRMRRETESLKLQLRTEMNENAALKGQISSVVEEGKAVRVDSDREKKQLLEEGEAVSFAAAQLEAEVVELREIHAVKSEKIVNLKMKVRDIMEESEILADDFEEQKSTCVDHLDSVKKAHSVVSLSCEQAACRIKELRLKSEEYRKASDTMEEMMITLPRVIEELQSTSSAEESKRNAASDVMSSLQSDVENSRSRSDISGKVHSTLLVQRQAFLLGTKVRAALKKGLKENVELAREYGTLQEALLMARRDALSVFEQKNRAQASFHDHKQLSLLQRRMHKAMLKYFKHRSVYSQAELARFQALFNQNNQKMKALQEESSRAARRLSAFLRSPTDDWTADEGRSVDDDGRNRALSAVHAAE
ncbi:coiled-coil domain-containing protein 178 isoform X2 [Hoplias malabaricus]|uniref:coiled-coil domain-containing protein 178 isoform X2 n=1 Tax=Hoplias malabaricus TaxID=27720 RepID=UPI0034621E0A